MLRCYSCQYGTYTAKEEENYDACWFVAKKDVPYKTYTLFKTITESQDENENDGLAHPHTQIVAIIAYPMFMGRVFY